MEKIIREMDEFNFSLRALKDNAISIHYRALNMSEGDETHYGRQIFDELTKIIECIRDLDYTVMKKKQAAHKLIEKAKETTKSLQKR